MKDRKKPTAFDFVTQDPKTGMMCEVSIVRYCPPGAEYSMPLSGEVQAQIAVDALLKKTIRYLYKQRK